MWKTIHSMINLPTGNSVVRMLFLFRRLTVSDGLSCWCCSRLPPQHCRDSISMKRVDPLPPRTWPRIYQVCHDISRVLVTESLTGTAMMCSLIAIFDRRTVPMTTVAGGTCANNLGFHKIRVTKDFPHL